MNVSVVCIAVLASIVFLLGMNVSRMRGVQAKAGASQFPSDPTDRLFKAVRAHGNATEYVPTLAILIALVGLRQPVPWMVAAMLGATASRLLHVYAIFTSATLAVQTPLRLVAAIGTYLFGLVLVAALLASNLGV
jgi:uncharacterized protein